MKISGVTSFEILLQSSEKYLKVTVYHSTKSFLFVESNWTGWTILDPIIRNDTSRYFSLDWSISLSFLGFHIYIYGCRDDQIILTALVFYLVSATMPQAQVAPWWSTKGMVVTAVLHAGPVEFLYYWLHRALHHHWLYARYHSHHHASIVTEPITSVIHPFAEEVVYFVLLAIPILSTVATGTVSVVTANGYLVYIDFMNYLGHCNFELVPKCLFHVFPPLKYLLYTPSYV